MEGRLTLDAAFTDQLTRQVVKLLAEQPGATFAIIGRTPTAYELRAAFHSLGAPDRLLGIYAIGRASPGEGLKAVTDLATDKPAVVVIAADGEKEQLLRTIAPHLNPSANVVIAGYAHLEFKNEIFTDVVQSALVPSLANGYDNSLIHVFQCLENAARRGLVGVVAEFGVFKGGTTMMLSRFIEHLGQSWKVIGFDTFAGFPPKRSLFDMYRHPDCVFSDEAAVRQYLSVRNVELVRGDLFETARRLAAEDIVLAFFDTDNYSSTTAILDVIQDRVVVGGALIFDHFTGSGRFKYTVGERLAAQRLLKDVRYFNLHGTGVFLRQS